MRMKKIISLVTLAVFMLAMPFAVAEETIDPAQLMEDVVGTYVPLFSVLNKPEYDDVWLSHSAEIVGEENAQMIADKKPFRSELWTSSKNATTDDYEYPLLGIANVVEDNQVYQETMDHAVVRVWGENG